MKLSNLLPWCSAVWIAGCATTAARAGVLLRGQAVGKDQAVHTAADIPISAYPPRAAVARQFVGVQRNTDVFFKLARALFGGY